MKQEPAISDQGVLEFLHNYGHMDWADHDDLGKLDLKNKDVQAAVASFQSLDINAEHLARKHHSRALRIDGDVGPATRELMTLPRCGCRDKPTAEGKMISEAIAEAQGSGSWPIPGCNLADSDRDKVHSVRINLRTSGMQLSQSYLDKCIEAAQRCYEEMGVRGVYILNGDPREAEMDIRFEHLRGSVIGWNQFPTPGTCNQVIDGRLDIGYTPSNWLWFANLMVHEHLGHGAGLNHTRGGIMNPSIVLVDPLSYRGDTSERTMRRYFGGVDVGPTPGGPGPEPDPDPEDPPVDDRPILKLLIEVFVTLIKDCIENGNATIGHAEDLLTTPRQTMSADEQYLAEREFRIKLGIKKSQWRDFEGQRIMNLAYDAAENMSPQARRSILAEVQESDREIGQSVIA